MPFSISGSETAAWPSSGRRAIGRSRPRRSWRWTLRQVAAKARTGPPSDDEADDDHPVWAGNVPIRSLVEAPVDDPRLKAEIARPDYFNAVRIG